MRGLWFLQVEIWRPLIKHIEKKDRCAGWKRRITVETSHPRSWQMFPSCSLKSGSNTMALMWHLSSRLNSSGEQHAPRLRTKSVISFLDWSPILCFCLTSIYCIYMYLPHFDGTSLGRVRQQYSSVQPAFKQHSVRVARLEIPTDSVTILNYPRLSLKIAEMVDQSKLERRSIQKYSKIFI